MYLSLNFIIFGTFINFSIAYINKKHVRNILNFSFCSSFNGEDYIIGCQSDENGNSARVVELNTTYDFLEFSKKFDSTFISLISYETFSKLKNENFKSNKLRGVLVYKSEKEVEFDSPESTFEILNHSWIEYANKRLVHNFQIPFFLLKYKKDVEDIRECISLHSHFCHAYMKSFMFSGAMEKGICFRRSTRYSFFQETIWCQPLGGYSIWASDIDFKKRSRKPSSVIILMSRIDSRSFFYQESPSAESVSSSISVLIATANLIRNIRKQKKVSLEKSLLFVLLNGETWDNIGSNKLIYDILSKSFPHKDYYLDLSEVDMVIQVDQSALFNKTYFGHLSLKKSEENENINMENFKKAFNHSLQLFSSLEYRFKIQKSYGLPPFNSLNGFANLNIPVILLSDFENNIVNRFFHSSFDDSKNINFTKEGCFVDSLCETTKKLSIVASSLAYSLINIASNGSFTMKPNELIKSLPVDIINRCLECLVISNNCSWIKEFYDVISIASYLTLKVSIHSDIESNHIGASSKYNLYLHSLLAYLASSVGEPIILKNNETCEATNLENNVIRLTKTKCYQASGSFMYSVSPIIANDGIDLLKFTNLLGIKLSSWHESVWNNPELSFYRINTRRSEIMFLMISFSSSISSLISIIVLIKKNLI